MPVSMLRELWQMNRQQWMSPDDLAKVQFEKARRQIQRAWSYSPFYRERFDSVGFTPQDFKSLDDLQRLPVITKAELTAAGDAAYCTDLKNPPSVWLKTSGSSGTPLSLPFTRADKSRRVLKELRALAGNGYKFTDQMMILVEPRCLIKEKAAMQKLGLLRRSYVSIFDEESDQLAAMQSMRPHVIYGYTSTLRILGEAILSGQVHVPRPKILMSSAELLDAGTRRLLTEAFGVEPVDFYGSMEFGWIGWQCPERHGYHVNSDCLIVEALIDGKPAPSDQEGEMVITNLHSDAAPLIRYASGDVGVLGAEKCSCGRTLPLLKSIRGRLVDFIMRPDGHMLSPYVVTCAVEDVPGVQQFQVVQKKPGEVTVRLVSPPSQAVMDEVQSAVELAMGGDTRVIVEKVSGLSPEPNGKFKVVKSQVGSAKATSSGSVEGCASAVNI